ncbi:MAG: hypothetical protein UW75_C0050G0006 [Parcubacteria group bacterium GW2011_GWF2_44_8]|nr:MAG: hypothetical protein UW75_C0050G0006 [Parcubacteria group bacterium GW2011_GWF2_44_8]
MTDFVKTILLVSKRLDTVLVFIIAFFLFSLLILISEKASALISLLQFEYFTFGERLHLALVFLFSIKSSFLTTGIILSFLGSLLGALNITFAYVYFKLQAEVLMKHHVYSGAGMFVAFLGVGCAACGSALLTAMLGMIGLSSILGFLPYQGVELGVLGLLILGVTTISLAKKVMGPKVC